MMNYQTSSTLYDIIYAFSINIKYEHNALFKKKKKFSGSYIKAGFVTMTYQHPVGNTLLVCFLEKDG